MIGVDTNVLVRYLAQDDPAQSALAVTFLERTIGADSPAFVSAIVLCEVSWVLSTAYHVERAILAHAIERILATETFVVEHAESAARAVAVFRVSAADFADCLIAEIARAAGCAETATFDKAFAKLEGVRLLR